MAKRRRGLIADDLGPCFGDPEAVRHWFENGLPFKHGREMAATHAVVVHERDLLTIMKGERPMTEFTGLTWREPVKTTNELPEKGSDFDARLIENEWPEYRIWYRDAWRRVDDFIRMRGRKPKEEDIEVLLECAAVDIGKTMTHLKRVCKGHPVGYDDLQTALDCVQRVREELEK